MNAMNAAHPSTEAVVSIRLASVLRISSHPSATSWAGAAVLVVLPLLSGTPAATMVSGTRAGVKRAPVRRSGAVGRSGPAPTHAHSCVLQVSRTIKHEHRRTDVAEGEAAQPELVSVFCPYAAPSGRQQQGRHRTQRQGSEQGDKQALRAGEAGDEQHTTSEESLLGDVSASGSQRRMLQHQSLRLHGTPAVSCTA